MNIVFLSSRDWPVADNLFDHPANRIIRVTGDLTAGVRRVLEIDPAIIFINQFEQNEALLTAVRSLCMNLVEASVVPVCNDPQPEFLMSLMRAGVREVLPDGSDAQIKDAFSRLKSRRASAHSKGQELARTVAFMSAKGGDGGSCVAANFAASLAHLEPESRILVVDLSLPFGDLEMYLTNRPAQHDLADFSDEMDRLDAALFDSMVHKISDNLHLINSPPSFEKIIHIIPANVERLLNIAVKRYKVVVIDLGTSIDPIGLQTLERLDQLIIVATLTMPSTRRTGQILRLWESLGYSSEKVRVAINRESGKSNIQVADFEKAMGMQVFLTLPTDTDGIQESLLKGVPTVQTHPKSAFSRLMLKWAREFIGKPAEEKSIWHRFGIK